ncbi:MAG: hypothetical protein ACKVW3_18350 [Phycisphaerales bacterium]
MALFFAVLLKFGIFDALPYRALGYSWTVSKKAAIARVEVDGPGHWLLLGAFIALSPLFGTIAGTRRATIWFLFGLAVAATINFRQNMR